MRPNLPAFLVSVLPILAAACAGPGSDRAGGAVPAPPSADQAPALDSIRDARERFRGVNWVAGRSVAEDDFESLRAIHADWIVQTPFLWQKRIDSPAIALVTDGRILWGEKDVGLIETTRIARRLGIRVLLKPHIWIGKTTGGQWRTDIAMRTEEDWHAWFADYRRAMLHYARLAETNRIEALCIGTELHRTAVERETDWRTLIRDIRKAYSGDLVYAANWYREFEEVAFWDDLDFIGIQAYFPLAERPGPTADELRAAWEPHRARIEAVQRRYGKPVLFTEIGYRSAADAAIEPWVWPQRRPSDSSEAGLALQAAAYEAFFDSFWNRDWFAGAFFWKWYPDLAAGNRRAPGGFSPQNKPAERVLARWYEVQPATRRLTPGR